MSNLFLNALQHLISKSSFYSLKTDWTWTNILSSFCWTNLKKAIRSVIHSRNKHGMICSPRSMENLALNMKRASFNSIIRNYWNIILMWRIYLRLRDFLGDEIQQKISAEDYVWDNYIKLHYHIYLVIGIHFYCISCV